jgi:tRNA pseudouridine32 synthase/23S rRNA pseudouridine746 synthase
MLRLLFLNPDVIVVDKPPGMLSVPGRGADKQDSVAFRLEKIFPSCRTVHRLDMETSGLLLFARHRDAQRQWQRAFEQRQVKKRYVAVVEGRMAHDYGYIDWPMRLDVARRPYQVIDFIQGKSAVTTYQVLERLPHFTRLWLFPQTGRSHQLRLHLKSLGHPIVGDTLYGQVGTRLLLHAESLASATDATAAWHSPCPF